MARRRRSTLLGEIGRLLVEYPEKDWRALAERLRDRALMEDIAAAIDESIAMIPKPVGIVRKQPTKPGVSEIARIARDDKAKADVLSAVKSRLTNKDDVVPLAYIRRFASSLGMKDELSMRREQAVNQIIRYLSTKTTDEIEAIMHAIAPMQQHAGQEFDRWVDLILRRGADVGKKPEGTIENE